MRYVSTALAFLCCAAAHAQRPGAEEPGQGPEPAPNPISWELAFKFEEPRRIEVLVPGSGQPEVYWYMLYTVVNTSDRTQFFNPTFELVTGDLRVNATDMGISPLVFEAIKDRHKIVYPYLVSPTRAIGELRAGADNARESVAIWRNVELRGNEFTIYVAGLSGETRFVKNPAYDPKKPETVKMAGPSGFERDVAVNPKHFTLRKTLEIHYTLPGSTQTRESADPQRQKIRWIMR